MQRHGLRERRRKVDVSHGGGEGVVTSLVCPFSWFPKESRCIIRGKPSSWYSRGGALKNEIEGPGMVAQACNSSYSRQQRGGLLFKTSLGKKKLVRPYLEKKVGAHFSSIYVQKKERKRGREGRREKERKKQSGCDDPHLKSQPYGR
jgi:hypothetical protein